LNRATADDGAELHFQETGKGASAVFIHGAFIADAFHPLLHEPSLAGRYSLIAYNRRGYGNSTSASGPISIARHARDCRDVLNELGATRAHVVGHSYGGAVALQLALDFPEMVNSLALLEPALIVGDSGAAYRESLQGAVKRYREAGAETVVDEFLRARWPEYRSRLERMLPGAFAQSVTDAKTPLECELPGLLEWTFGEAEARCIGHPTLCLIGGERAALSPRFEEAQRLLLSWLPNGKAHVVPGTTHLMHIEAPQQTAEALAAFWGRPG
jgi:pimeloyl-ACP methyl ester carboxylesterase